MKKVSVYIDGANFYHGVKSVNGRYSDFYFNFEKYIEKITKWRKLVDVYYYNAPLKQQLG